MIIIMLMVMKIITTYRNNLHFFAEGKNSDSLLSLCPQLGITTSVCMYVCMHVCMYIYGWKYPVTIRDIYYYKKISL